MEITQQKIQEDKGISIAEILAKYLRHWVWFVVSVAVCLGIGVLFLLSKDVLYSVSMYAMLNDEKSVPANDAQLEALGIHPTANNLDNEIIILKSPDLMAQVVNALHIDVSYYTVNLMKRRDYLFTESPYNVSFNPGNDVTLHSLEMSIRRNNSVFIIDGTCSASAAMITFLEELRELPGTIYLPDNIGTITIEGTGKAIPPICYVEINKVRNVASALASALEIKPASNQSSVLKLDLRIHNSNKGAAILEELVRQYNESASKEKKTWAFNTSTFINERLSEISVELGLVEDDVVEYKQQHKIADITSETSLYLQQTTEYEKQKIDAETQLRIINMLDRFVQTNNRKSIPNLGVNDPELSQAISEYNENVTAYEQLVKSASENNPTRLRLEKTLATMRSRILTLIRTERESSQITLANIQEQGLSVYSRIQSLPQQERGLLEKERQQKVIENLFLFLMQKREEANVAMASSMEKAKIIISPTNGSKVYPSGQRTLAMFVFFGLAFPAVLIFLADFLRSSVSDIYELKRLTPIKIIGEICHDKHSIVLEKKTTSFSGELFRMLRNNIDYHFGHESHKVILVTSSVYGEGKTFVGINLAVAFALLNKRVLLIDTDLRKANLNKYLHSKSTQGLTDFLTKGMVKWEKVIEYMNHFPALHLLKAGAIPPNPNELLMSSRFKAFIEEVKMRYDYVLLDSPPAGLVPDAFVMAEYADMTLCVVREKRTSKDMISSFNSERYPQLNNLHIVYNDMMISKPRLLQG